ncbi:MAG: hypothetical protein R2818_04730 [Flavobacteriales bacterium]
MYQDPIAMRTAAPLLALLFTTSLHAQLINGSFESDGTPSLEGWEWTCGGPGQANDGAPGAGSWSATLQPGHAKGCFPSYLYQRLPSAVNGEFLTLSGWVKCPDFGVCQGGFLQLGHVRDGAFELEESVSAQGLDWSFITITDTVEIAAGDTAIVLLHSGFIGGPVAAEGSYFDGITLDVAMATNELGDSDVLLVRQSPDGRSLAVNAGIGEGIRMTDALGRTLAQAVGNSSGWTTVPIPEGQTWVLVTVDGTGRQRSQRVVVR